MTKEEMDRFMKSFADGLKQGAQERCDALEDCIVREVCAYREPDYGFIMCHVGCFVERRFGVLNHPVAEAEAISAASPFEFGVTTGKQCVDEIRTKMMQPW